MAKQIWGRKWIFEFTAGFSLEKGSNKDRLPQVQGYKWSYLPYLWAIYWNFRSYFFLHVPLSGRYGDVLTFPASVPGQADTLIVLISLSPGFKIISLNSCVTGLTWNKVLLVCWQMWHAEMNSLSGMWTLTQQGWFMQRANVCGSAYWHHNTNGAVSRISFSHIFKEVLRQMWFLK